MAEAAQIFNFPPDQAAVEHLSPIEYDQSIRQYIAQLSRISKAVWAVGQLGDQNLLEVRACIISCNTGGRLLILAIQILDPAVNTIPYLFVLVHQFQTKVESANTAANVPEECRPGGELWLKLINFLSVFDPVQIRYVGIEWRKAVEYVDRVVRLMDTVCDQ